MERLVIQWANSVRINSFQIWTNQNPKLSSDPLKCDEVWLRLTEEYMAGYIHDELKEEIKMGWQNIPYIFEMPLYYNQLSIAILGALQIFENYLEEPDRTIEKLRYGMSMGNTKNLPQVFSAMGIKLAFDGKTILSSTAFMLRIILDLESNINT